jgi:hypothetical protein
LKRLRELLETIAQPESTLACIDLSGVVSSEDEAELTRLQGVIDSRFLFGRLDSTRLRPRPDDDQWLTRLPAMVLRDVAAQLCQWADPAFAGERPSGASPEVATQALMELYHTVQEVPR